MAGEAVRPLPLRIQPAFKDETSRIKPAWATSIECRAHHLHVRVREQPTNFQASHQSPQKDHGLCIRQSDHLRNVLQAGLSAPSPCQPPCTVCFWTPGSTPCMRGPVTAASSRSPSWEAAWKLAHHLGPHSCPAARQDLRRGACGACWGTPKPSTASLAPPTATTSSQVLLVIPKKVRCDSTKKGHSPGLAVACIGACHSVRAGNPLFADAGRGRVLCLATSSCLTKM